jgi:hypothetical protein
MQWFQDYWGGPDWQVRRSTRAGGPAASGARKLFDEAKVLAARIANAKAPAAVDVRRFDELYDADLIGVEQPGGDVEKAMVRFRRKLRGEPGEPNDDIDQLALPTGARL